MKFFLHPKYPFWLLVATLTLFVLSAIDVPHPDDFKLEHYMTIAFIVILVSTYRIFPLSHISYTLVFLFLSLHILGAHYTYSEVPYDLWFQNWFGFSIDKYFEFERNMYDRLVHFSFGLLLAYPAREVFNRLADAKGFWSLYFPLDLMAAFSMVYELFEWWVAISYGGSGVDATYIGSQGDVWDAQKDMALATLGALIAITIVAIINIKLNPQFWHEIKASLRIKIKDPLGEVKISSWLNDREKQN